MHNSEFSYLGVPAQAGMGDCYENMMNSLTSYNWSPTIFILLCGLHKAMVIPAKGDLCITTGAGAKIR